MSKTGIYTSEIPFGEEDMLGDNLADVVVKACDKHAALPALSVVLPNGQSQTLSYKDLQHYSDAVAAWLVKDCGLKSGDVVALQSVNSLAFPVVAFGALKAGVTLTNINPMYTSAEAQYQLQDSGAVMLFVIDVFGATVAETIKDTKVRSVVRLSLTDLFPKVKAAAMNFLLQRVLKKIPEFNVPYEDTLGSILKKGKMHLASGFDAKTHIKSINPETAVFYQYTGGTTGRSKGAALSHHNLVSNVSQGRLHNGITDEDSGESVLLVLPLYHVYALAVGCISSMVNGFHVVLVPSPKPLSNLKAAFELCEISMFPAINTLFLGLLNEDWFKGDLIKPLRVCMSGGAPLAPETADAWKKHTGIEIHEGYGLTESTCAAISNRLASEPVRNNVGKPLPGTDIRFVDDDGHNVPRGERGEVWVRGPQIMTGYLGNPEATAETIEDGWLKTGDIGLIDNEGNVHIVDRKKDMVLVSGFNVFPTDIEAVLVTCPQVADAGVVGVPDPATGEKLVAWVVKAKGCEDLDAKTVTEHCRRELTGYKVPRDVRFIDELPKSAVGKVLRRELRDQTET